MIKSRGEQTQKSTEYHLQRNGDESCEKGESKPALRPECVQDLVKDQAENDQEDGQDVALEIPK